MGPGPDDTRVSRVRELALACGFDAAGIAPVALPEHAAELRAWIEAGHAGDMAWLARHPEVRTDLRERFPWARSVVVVARSYRGAPTEPRRGLARYVSRYAWGDDYHDVLLPRLQELATRLEQELPAPGLQSHAYVDTGPVLERQLAEAAGLGWRGKNTLLLNERAGSQFFLGILVTDLDLAPGRRTTVSCGTCAACQPACPTDAFVRPGVLDARRCISYLTIEHRGPIDRELRAAMGEWLFGCDLCQTACPFDHGQPARGEAAFALGKAVAEISLPELLALDEEGFRTRFRRTPLWRPRREGLLRNALIVAANGDHRACLPAARRLLDDPSPALREAASWCVAQMHDLDALPALRVLALVEPEPWVRTAIRADVIRLEADVDG